MKARKTSLDAGGKSIAILNGKDSLELGLHPLDKVVIKKGPRKITATIDTSKNLVKKGNIFVYDEISRILKLKNNDTVDVEPLRSLMSHNFIKKKVEGEELNDQELRAIVEDVIARNLAEVEIASFITA